MSATLKDAKLSQAPFPADRVMGYLMLAGFAILSLQSAWGAAHQGPPTQNLSLLRILTDFVFEAWYSIGVLRGRRWAFVLAVLISTPKLFQEIVSQVTFAGYFHRISLVTPLSISFFIVVILYGGARLFRLGPFTGDRFDLRRETEKSPGFIADRIVSVFFVAIQAGILLLSLGDLGREWLKAMPTAGVTLFEWMDAYQWGWLLGNLVLVVQCVWIGLGIYRARAWAFVAGLFAAVGLLMPFLIYSVAARLPLSPSTMAVAIFYLAFFLYCGLRAFGNLGPRPGDRFALRDPELDDDDLPAAPASAKA